MTTATLTITDFLLARIAEDEAVVHRWDGDARALVGVMWTGGEPGYTTAAIGSGESDEWVANGVEIADPRHVQVVFDPARVLAECAAKRGIVEHAQDADATERTAAENAGWDGDRFDTAGASILRALAAVYSDHPDFRSEWRP